MRQQHLHEVTSLIAFSQRQQPQTVKSCSAQVGHRDKLSKAQLLILDDFGLTHLDKQQRMDLMEIMEDRHAKMATIIASQLPVENWYDVFAGDDTLADAVLDRIVHGSYTITLKGESMRKKR